MKRNVIVLYLLTLINGCYVEWDVPKTPRHDPCTGQVEDKYVYVNPECRQITPVPSSAPPFPQLTQRQINEQLRRRQHGK